MENQRIVEVIHSTRPSEGRRLVKKRVAAYCRVSTDKEEQQSSLETQIGAFQDLISARDEWVLVEVFADEGLSGTRVANRVQFQRMIADCEAGKIDYIVTKSISRFARNTVECLQYARKLKDMGVYIFFEKEHLDTSATSSEMLLSILAAVAQEESHSISENLKWGYRKRFQIGIPKWPPTFGYEFQDGKVSINARDARIVKRIFELYVSGQSLPQIDRTLQREGYTSFRGKKWWPKTLATILHNEKYMGDIMMQKSYTVDHLTHRKVRNDQTVVPSYYVRDHHEAIVDRKTFERVQTILALRDLHLGCTQYPYYGTLICPVCGRRMIRYCLPTQAHPAAWTCGGDGGVAKRRDVSETTDRRGRPGASARHAVSTTIDRRCLPYAIGEKYVDRLVADAYAGLDVIGLMQIKAEEGEASEALRQAINMKKKQPKLKSVEYVFLDTLVKEITFKDWNTALVRWKFGMTSEIAIHYEKASDIPAVSFDKTENGVTVHGKPIRNAELVMRCAERIHKSVRAVSVEDSGGGQRPCIRTRYNAKDTMPCP